MSRTFAASGVYFAIVFCLAFMLGVVRTLMVAPLTGEVAAVLIETPVVLLISWFAAGWSIRRYSVTAKATERLAMGFAAFALLMIAEAVLALLAFGQPATQYLASYATLAGGVGLLAQIAFGLIPLLAARPR